MRGGDLYAPPSATTTSGGASALYTRRREIHGASKMTVSAATGCSFLLSTAVNAEAHAHPAWGVRQDMGAAAWSEDESIAWTHRLYVGRRHHRTRGSGGKNRKACLHGRQRVIGGEIWGKVLLRT